MMLSQYYNRRSSLQLKKEEQTPEEESIIQSFYEERRSRSSQNAKQHSLLRKNISYFHEERDNAREEVYEGFEKNVTRSRNVMEGKQENKVGVGNFSRPAGTKLGNIPIPPSIPKPQQLPKPAPLQQTAQNHNQSNLSSNFSTINLSKHQSQEEDYKARLKQELSKRINIKHYLTQLSQENKENAIKTLSNPNSNPPTKLELKFNYDCKVPQRVQLNTPTSQISGIFNSINRESAIDQSRHSITSLLHQNPTQNNFQFSRNEIPNRQGSSFRDQSFSQSRHSLHTLGQSGARSNNSSRKTQKQDRNRNVLMGEQLQDLQENSHPIRNMNDGSQNQPTTQKHNLKYFQPQAHAEYKRRIGDLQRQLSQLKNQHRREDKFIQSIQKMRRIMQGQAEDCNLKQLWRWIKLLPHK